MRFGIHSSGERPGRLPADAWNDDLFEIQTADELGFQEAWLREHAGTNGPMPVPEIFITKAAALTKQIRLGPGGRSLALYNPIDIATQAAMCDVLTEGRYNFAFQLGAPVTDEMEQRGLGESSVDTRRERMHAAIDLLLQCWTATEPFDYKGKFWQCKGISVVPKPLQKPHMPVGTCCNRTNRTAEMAGRRGFMPLFSEYEGPAEIRECTEAFLEAARSAGREPDRSAIRVCRFIYVAESVREAKDALRDSFIPHIERDKRLMPEHFQESLPASGKVEDLNFDHLVDAGYYMIGDPDSVYGHIKGLYEQLGGFGVMLFRAGTDRGTRDGRAQSMRLFAEYVAPRLAELEPHSSQPVPA